MISIHYSLTPGATRFLVTGITSYSHEIMMIGGCRNASVSFGIDIQSAEDWFYNGVGRHIEVHSASGVPVWEGAVDTVSINIGGRAITTGPLLDVSNNIAVGYRYPNHGTGSPSEGEYAETDWATNVESISRYGQLDEFVSGGEGYDDAMDDLRDALLVKNGEPKVLETISSSGEGNAVSISLSCVGYSRLLEKQVYNKAYTGNPDEDLYLKVNDIIAANLYFVDDRALILNTQPTGIITFDESEDNGTAWAIISDHISKSSEANDTVLGFFPGMNFTLAPVTDDFMYTRRAESSVILDDHGGKVENSEVFPGGIMRMIDFSTPITYRISSIKYDLQGDSVYINFHESSLRHILSGTMLGGL